MTDYDPPYTTPEEDPFNVVPARIQPRRKRSSMLDKWINEQQRTHSIRGRNILDLTDDRTPSQARHADAYFPYPGPAGHLAPHAASRVTVDSYDMVEDEDIVNELASLRVSSDCESPPTPNSPRSRNSKLLHSPSASFRSFHFPFRNSHSPAPGSSSSPPSTPSRRSLFSRMPSGGGPSTRFPSTVARDSHKRSASASVAEAPSPPTNLMAPSLSKARPSVLGHFPSASQVSVPPSDTAYTPSRPSMSSHTTCTSTAPTSEDEATPMKASFVDSVRVRSKSHGASSIMSFSGWSQRPESPPTIGDAPSERTERYSSMSQRSGSTRGGSARVPFAPKSVSRLSNSEVREAAKEAVTCIHLPQAEDDLNKPYVIYGPNSRPSTLSRVSFSRHKKKTLVISGITAGDVKRFDGVRRWCESFGSVNQILRMPNGDLHVHFQSGEVADTVCRLRAKVFITGVGSVQLSFLTGGK
ncbi:hypothetical protein K523DRAFT_225711 [Schizophyllum commune Tattone D]|nr:hypothetical protein K523DRAFT_225711 [Schizophyllum commune Tattone D]